MPLYRANVGAVTVNADRDTVFERVRHGVNVANRRADQIDAAGLDAMFAGFVELGVRSVPGVFLTLFRATHHAHHAPHSVVMHRRGMAWPPDEAGEGKAFERVAVEQVLLVFVRMWFGKCIRQPVVVRNQIEHQGLAPVEHDRFIAALVLDG